MAQSIQASDVGQHYNYLALSRLQLHTNAPSPHPRRHTRSSCDTRTAREKMTFKSRSLYATAQISQTKDRSACKHIQVTHTSKSSSYPRSSSGTSLHGLGLHGSFDFPGGVRINCSQQQSRIICNKILFNRSAAFGSKRNTYNHTTHACVHTKTLDCFPRSVAQAVD